MLRLRSAFISSHIVWSESLLNERKLVSDPLDSSEKNILQKAQIDLCFRCMHVHFDVSWHFILFYFIFFIFLQG